VRYLTVSRRDSTGVDKLTSLTLRRVEGPRTVEWRLGNPAEFFAALADVFGLTLDDLDQPAKDALYRRARTAQVDWAAHEAG